MYLWSHRASEPGVLSADISSCSLFNDINLWKITITNRWFDLLLWLQAVVSLGKKLSVCVCVCACVFELWGVLDRKYCIGPDVPVGTLHAVLSVYECVHECVLKPSESSKNVYCCSFILKHEIGGTSQLSFWSSHNAFVIEYHLLLSVDHQKCPHQTNNSCLETGKRLHFPTSPRGNQLIFPH